MQQSTIDQYNDLKSKDSMSPEETAVVEAYDALKAAEQSQDRSALKQAKKQLADAQSAMPTE